MTVVAWDGRTLAADKLINFGGLHGTGTKVFRVYGSLVAGCGTSALIAEMHAWIAAGCDPATFPAAQRDEKANASMLVIRPGGQVLQFESTPYPIVINNTQWAIGSGRDFALMAMHLGKTAAEAVVLASHFCANCGNGVDALHI